MSPNPSLFISAILEYVALSHVGTQEVFVKPLVAFQVTIEIAVLIPVELFEPTPVELFEPIPIVLFEFERSTTSSFESLLTSPITMSKSCPTCNIPPLSCGENDIFRSAVYNEAECGNKMGSEVDQFDPFEGITLYVDESLNVF